MSLEANHENRFVIYARGLGLEALKLRIDGQDGFPDRTVVTPDGIFYIEFKRDRSEKLRPQQRRWIKRLSVLGYTVLVAYSFEEAKEFTDSWLAK